MNFQESETEFEARLYRWSREELRKEIEAGFPLVRLVQGSGSWKYLEYMRTLDDKGKHAFGVAGLKLAHGRAADLLGDFLTSEQTRLNEQFRSFSLWTLYPREQEFLAQAQTKGRMPRVNRRGLWRTVKNALRDVLGDRLTDLGGGTRKYTTNIGPWAIETYVDTGGSYSDLSYFHKIGIDNRFFDVEFSLFGWLGVGGLTRWDCLVDADCKATADAIRHLCAHFLTVAPKLLSGLEPSA